MSDDVSRPRSRSRRSTRPPRGDGARAGLQEHHEPGPRAGGAVGSVAGASPRRRSAQRRHRGHDRRACDGSASAVEPDWDAARPIESGRAATRTRSSPPDHADLFVANSGTTMRFLTAMVALGHGRYRLDGVPRMRERPIDDLLDALRPARRPTPTARRATAVRR